MGLSVIQIADRLRNEADAYRFVEELRWGDGEPVCPHCQHEGATFLQPRTGEARRTRTGAMSQRRVWKCHGCRKQFSAITGTCFHGTKVALRIWVLVIFEMCASKNGVAAREIERKYGVCNRTAWFMMHRIREAMTNDGLAQMMRGEVVADECFIGGSESNRHKSVREAREPVPYFRRGAGKDKAAVLSLIDRSTGEVRSKVVPDVTGATLRKVIAEQCDMASTVLFTDEGGGYKTFASELAGHESVNHTADEYVRYEPDGSIVTSNDAENFFSQLKRSLDGTHHHVSRVHLQRYLSEFDYRYSTRKMSDEARLHRLMGQTGGKRLTYKRVTG